MTNYQNLPDAALVRKRQLVGDPKKQLPGILPFSHMTLWRRVKSGTFPAPTLQDGRITAWRWGDVKAWLEAQGGGQ